MLARCMVTAVMYDPAVRYRARSLPGHASIDNGRLCTRHCIQTRHAMRVNYYLEAGSRFSSRFHTAQVQAASHVVSLFFSLLCGPRIH